MNCVTAAVAAEVMVDAVLLRPGLSSRFAQQVCSKMADRKSGEVAERKLSVLRSVLRNHALLGEVCVWGGGFGALSCIL